VNQLNRKGEAKVRFVDETVSGLKQAGDLLTMRGNFQGALELLAYEQELQPNPPERSSGGWERLRKARRAG